jgi:hypothetical protein
MTALSAEIRTRGIDAAAGWAGFGQRRSAFGAVTCAAGIFQAAGQAFHPSHLAPPREIQRQILRGMLGARESTVAWLFRSNLVHFNLVHFNLAKPSFMDI